MGRRGGTHAVPASHDRKALSPMSSARSCGRAAGREREGQETPQACGACGLCGAGALAGAARARSVIKETTPKIARLVERREEVAQHPQRVLPQHARAAARLHVLGHGPPVRLLLLHRERHVNKLLLGEAHVAEADVPQHFPERPRRVRDKGVVLGYEKLRGWVGAGGGVPGGGVRWVRRTLDAGEERRARGKGSGRRRSAAQGSGLWCAGGVRAPAPAARWTSTRTSTALRTRGGRAADEHRSAPALAPVPAQRAQPSSPNAWGPPSARAPAGSAP